MWILISFCNSIKRSKHYSKFGWSQIAALNLETRQINFLRIPQIINPQGFTGITHDDKFIYIVTQGKKQAYLLRLQKKGLKIDLVKKTGHIADPHSMILFENRLYVVSTGTNTIEVFSPETLEYLGRYWQYPSTTTFCDQVHLNSLFVSKSQLWTSAFGPKTDEKWSSAAKGALINTTNNSQLYTIYHPHSATYHQNSFYYCESWTGSIFRNENVIKKIEGSYLRGLDVNSDYLIIGVSSGREKSKSRGVINDPSEAGRYNSFSGIVVQDRKQRKELYFDLSQYSPEIYQYTREIYSLKLISGIVLTSSDNILSHYKLEPSPVIERNHAISILINENQKLRIKFGRLLRKKNKLVDEVHSLKRKINLMR